MVGCCGCWCVRETDQLSITSYCRSIEELAAIGDHGGAGTGSSPVETYSGESGIILSKWPSRIPGVHGVRGI